MSESCVYMREFEFINPKGGRLVWEPGDIVQDNLGNMTEEEIQLLQTELTPIFGQFTLLLSGSIVEDKEDRSRLLGMYDDLFRHFIKTMLVSLTFGNRDIDSEEPGSKP